MEVLPSKIWEVFVFLFGSIGAYAAFFISAYAIIVLLKHDSLKIAIETAVSLIAVSVAATNWYPDKTGTIAASLYKMINEYAGGFNAGIFIGCIIGYLFHGFRKGIGIR